MEEKQFRFGHIGYADNINRSRLELTHARHSGGIKGVAML